MVTTVIDNHQKTVWCIKFVCTIKGGIPQVLTIMVSCHGFSKGNTPTVIFSCGRKLVSYYVSTKFVILPKIHMQWKTFQQMWNIVSMHWKYKKIFRATVIASVENTLKNIYLIDDFLLNLNPNYFKRKNFIFRISSDITWRITLEILNILNWWTNGGLIWTRQHMKATWKDVLPQLLR